MKTGPLFLKMRNCDKPIIINQGGGDSMKTVSTLQHLAIKQIENPKKTLCTVTGVDLPNLRGGALRSFQNYVVPDIEKYISKYNESSHTYHYYNKSVLEFKSFENEQDARGSERDYLFVNEMQGVPYNMFWQLERKTRILTCGDYNPTARFYVHDKLLPKKDGTCGEMQYHNKVQLFISNHWHNPFLSERDHDRYESISDPDLFRVYSRGLTGAIRGLVFGHFKVAPFPTEGLARIVWGLDLGYTNDPTSLIKIGVDANAKKRYAHECCYAPGISAETIRDLLIFNGYTPDQALYCEPDPNMINPLRALGIPAQPAIKGPGSLAAGIARVREYQCYATAESKNFWKEIGWYKFIEAQDLMTGKTIVTNQPIDEWNHSCDAFRMAHYTDLFRNR